jgi:hypothetical protein
MPSFLSGPGLGLALPQNLYPTELQNAPYDFSNSRVTLAPGACIQFPAGDWYYSLGMYLVLQYLDPVTGVWVTGASGGWESGVGHVSSDGFNVRIANLTGCVVAASITAAGSGYAQATTTITVTSAALQGNAAPTILPIIGGALVASGGTLAANGAGYGVAPIAFIPAPPPAANNPNGVGGIPASGYPVLSSGTLTGFTFTNQGAGYPSAPPIVLLPSPFDPNLLAGSSITLASLVVTLTASGSLTGALVTNNGAPLANGSLANITLTVGGAGSAASLTAVVMQTVAAASVVAGGTGYSSLVPAAITSVGGVPPAGAITASPDANQLAWKPRPLQASIGNANGTTTLAVGQLATIYDGGLFEGAPVLILGAPQGVAAPTTLASLALVMGSRPDVAILQPAP